MKTLLFYWALKYFHLLQFSVPPFRRIAILSAENEKAIIASKLLEPNFIRMTVTALAPPRSSGRLVLPAIAEKIIFSGGLSRSYIPPAGRLLFYWAEKYFQALQESVFFVLIAIFSQPNEKANCAVYISLPGLCCITQHPLLSNLGSPLGFISVFKINAAGGLSKSDTFFSQIENRLLFNLQNCNFESKITCRIS